MLKIIKLIITLNIFFSFNAFAIGEDFSSWLKDFKKKAILNGISEEVVNDVMSDARFLPKVIQYDRYQPEFYEDTFTYIKKRTSKKKLEKVLNFIKKKKKLLIK